MEKKKVTPKKTTKRKVKNTKPKNELSNIEEIINESEQDIVCNLSEDGKKLIVNIIENPIEKWRNRLAYGLLLFFIIMSFTN
tara:strand:- start:1025 stop:1270 length:246 start_codon:yes stop_codon:yes gene_type:complete